MVPIGRESVAPQFEDTRDIYNCIFNDSHLTHILRIELLDGMRRCLIKWTIRAPMKLKNSAYNSVQMVDNVLKYALKVIYSHLKLYQESIGIFVPGVHSLLAKFIHTKTAWPLNEMIGGVF
jgi:hypothetical protein